MQPKYILNDNTHVVETVRRSDDIVIEVDGHKLDARIHWRDSHQCELTINGVAREVYAAQDDNKIFLHLDGKTFQLDVVDEFGDADEAGAASVDYLMYSGYVAMGLLWARAAATAQAAIAAGTSEKAFYEAKITTARFYFERIMPRTLTCAAAIKSGADNLMSMSEADFAL